jgi:hypothetical protein
MHRDEDDGLTPLDQERARSMADEGGASGAQVEGEAELPARPRTRYRFGPLPLVMLALVPH